MIGPTRAPRLSERATGKAPDEFDRLTGDGLRLKKSLNKDSLWIKGDGCRITLATNSGRLRVSGDGCRVYIGCNLGSVEYNGDGGHIILGPESTQDCSDRVVYKGDGGLIDFAGKRKRVAKSSQAKETAAAAHASSRGDMRTKIVGSSNVHIHLDLCVRDK
ncbi:uncharacterized protein LOC131664501 [Phymastichus coffea]|uniref:uncharacterized protein LOC131664501 n=1 Tax=Phymastichus coffea TaxID=108790 RepID=UPI00273BC4B1|nr:uncharacterized protein LOC131664501 [Phymastichus coffea]